MSIATEISRLQTAKSNIKTSIENKGVTVGSSVTLDQYPALIDSIQFNLSPIVLRPDAELVKTYSYDKYINADEGVTIPSYTTTDTTLLASSNLSETYTMLIDNSYFYYIVESMLAIPEYSISTVGTGREEYFVSSAIYNYCTTPVNLYAAIVDPTKIIASRSASMVDEGTFFKLAYWSNSTTFTVTSANMGAYMTKTAPTVSSGVITFKTPVLKIRGSTSYFTSTYFNALTDIRYQWIIKVYRAPSNSYGVDGWEHSQNLTHIIECATSNTHTLT